MNRRNFFLNGSAAAAFTAFASPLSVFGGNPQLIDTKKVIGKAKNIIFMVSDGMSAGTLNMADLFLQRKEGRSSHWLKLYRDNRVRRALMDTASASSLITDSAAAGSSWGGGVRVKNGSLNVGPNGEQYKPVLQKFKAAGKAVGCVTTVPITHATPASFCVNSGSRGDQAEIAMKYAGLGFDVMMGGGLEFFKGNLRKDGIDMFDMFKAKGYEVALTRNEMAAAAKGKPLLGVFHEDGLPYSLDHQNDKNLLGNIPTLADMTATAIERMKNNPKGFVMQVEGGRVDWAAHGNDIGGLIYDQVAFDDAVKTAIDFAEKDKKTLVVITTDHGNANPGLFYGSKADQNFDKVQHFKQTNSKILTSISPNSSISQVRELVETAQGIVLTPKEAHEILGYYTDLSADALYNPYKLPFARFAQMQSAHTSVGWGGDNHSADFVELAMFGPGSEALPAFVINTELHNFMLDVCGVKEGR